MSKDSRNGGKFSGAHTTLIPAATIVADVASACESVYRIIPRFIKMGLKSVGGNRRVKITRDGNHILLSVRDNASQQEIHIYADKLEVAVLAIARGARNANLAITFK